MDPRMVYHLVLFSCVLLVSSASCELGPLEGNQKSSIAIIGAGVGGSTAAWFIREQLGADVHIDMYVALERLASNLEICKHQHNIYWSNETQTVDLRRFEQGDIGGRTQIFKHGDEASHFMVLSYARRQLHTLFEMMGPYAAAGI